MTPTKETIAEKALALIESHFRLISAGNLLAARRQLFCPPGIAPRPIDTYLETMNRLKPFRLVSASVSRLEGVRRKRHGEVATVWLNVVVVCSLGERAAQLVVWWFPETNEYQISARPSHWVIEALRGDREPS